MREGIDQAWPRRVGHPMSEGPGSRRKQGASAAVSLALNPRSGQFIAGCSKVRGA